MVRRAASGTDRCRSSWTSSPAWSRDWPRFALANPTRGPPKVIGNWHHEGTTRMHADPSAGVVDTDCRVHGLDNLYVAGSSVFPASRLDLADRHHRAAGPAPRRSTRGEPRRSAAADRGRDRPGRVALPEAGRVVSTRHRAVRAVPWLLALVGLAVPMIGSGFIGWPLAASGSSSWGSSGSSAVGPRHPGVAADRCRRPVARALPARLGEGGWWLIPADLAWLVIEFADRPGVRRRSRCLTSVSLPRMREAPPRRRACWPLRRRLERPRRVGVRGPVRARCRLHRSREPGHGRTGSDLSAADVSWSMTGARMADDGLRPRRHGVMALVLRDRGGTLEIEVMHNLEVSSPPSDER